MTGSANIPAVVHRSKAILSFVSRTAPFAALLIVSSVAVSGCGESGDGEGPFVDVGAGVTGVFYCSLAWGDYDNDGDLDLALAGEVNSSTRISKVYRNDGGTFVDIDATLTGVDHCSLAWGDYDSDGDLDLALVGFTGSVRIGNVYRNDGGTFTDIGAGLTGVDRCSLAWGDYDNDGDLDLALAGCEDYEMRIFLSRIYRNDSGTFTDISANIADVRFCALAWGDYDLDGDLDLALAGDDGTSYICNVYSNDSGTFADVGAGLTGGSGSLAWGDFDSDGDLDLALAGYDASAGRICKVYRNDSGAFINIGAGLAGVSSSSLAWGDCDSDGDLDLAVAGFTNHGDDISRVYRNDDGKFAQYAALTGVSIGSLAWGDYDNDGDLDLVLAGYVSDSGSPACRLYRNDGGVSNAAPGSPNGLSANYVGTDPYDVTFSWNAATDAQTAQPGLTYNLRVGTVADSDDVMPGMSIIGGANDGKRLIPSMGNVQHNRSWTLNGLAAGTYYWSVQAIDACFLGSSWAPEQIITVP